MKICFFRYLREFQIMKILTVVVNTPAEKLCKTELLLESVELAVLKEAGQGWVGWGFPTKRYHLLKPLRGI